MKPARREREPLSELDGVSSAVVVASYARDYNSTLVEHSETVLWQNILVTSMAYEGGLLVCVSTEFMEPIRLVVEATRERGGSPKISP